MSTLTLLVLLSAPCAQPPCESMTELSGIYERPGFERARERNSGAFAALFNQARAWFLALFETRGAQTYSNATRVLVLVVALAVGLFTLLRWRRRRPRAVAPSASVPDAALHLDSPREHADRAEALLAEHPREAIREALFSLLAWLERRQLARPDRTRTNRELAAALPTHGAPPELVAVVSDAFDWFDRTFYSLGEVSSAEARRFLDDVRRLTT